MYVPSHFAPHGPAFARSLIERHPFGTLVSSVEGRPFATHVPILLEGDPPASLLLHLAKANPQWKEIDGRDVLAIFHGPHAMISAAWYDEPALSVPTWNYAAVHVSGRAHTLDGERTRAVLERIVERFEPQWRIDGADAAYIERMERAIVGVEIAITRIDAKEKYSQNRSRPERERAIEHLSRSERCGDRETAQAMRESLTSPAPPHG